MNSTKAPEIFLSREDICAILEASAKAGVSELQFRDLHVRFGRPAEQVVVQDPATGQLVSYPFVPQAPASPVPVKTLTDKEHATLGQDALEQDELLLREEQMAHLLVADPLKYEEMLRAGELSDGPTSNTDDDEDDL